MSRQTRYEQQRSKYLRKAGKARGREERTPSDDIETLLELTTHDNPNIRCEAARKLCPCHIQANNSSIWDRLLAMAHDPAPKVRATILHTLADGSPHEREWQVIKALENMYHDPDPKLRRQVRRLLAQYRRNGKINVL
jgi:HEAT repeat protein